MTMMISLRTFRLASTTGHIHQFEAKVPSDVAEALVPEAMAAGCVPVDADDIPFLEDLSRAKVEFQGDVRRSMLYLAVKLIAEENNPKNFDGGGTPKTSVVTARLGFEIARQELLDVYQIYQSVKADSREYVLHPSAPNILRVLEADSKGELVELAAEFGVDADKAAGLQMRDLRKLLLVKFNGATGA